MGGSSKKQTVGYKYYVGMHQALCHGPVDKVTKIEVDSRTAWVGESTGGRINVSAQNLFGGEGREGGISGPVDIEMGGPAQGANDYLKSILGDSIPAFRGVLAAVLRQVYAGTNPYLKPWKFRAQRIHTRQGGLTQWYDEKSEIELTEATTGSVPLFSEDFSAGLSSYSIPDTFYTEDNTFINTGDQNYKMTAISDSEQSYAAITHDEYNKPTGAEDGGEYQGTDCRREVSFSVPFSGLSCYMMVTHIESQEGMTLQINGGFGVSPAFSLQAISHSAVDPNQSVRVCGQVTGVVLEPADLYKFVSDVVDGVLLYKIYDSLDNELYSGSVPDFPQIIVQRLNFLRNPGSFQSVSAYANITISGFGSDPTPGHSDINPAHIIRECLTDPDWGMGYQEADVDDVEFTGSADTLYDEAMGMSLLWDRQMPIDDFIAEVLKHINGNLYVSRTTGKFVLKLIRDNYSESDLPIFDENNIQSITNASRPSIGELVNSVTVNYWDAATGETASVTAQDQALMQAQGAVVNTTVQYPGFTNHAIASRVALRDLKSLSTELLSCDITANREAADLNIGDPFILNWPDLGIHSVVMRVQGLELGDMKRGQIKITAVQDVFAAPDTAIVSAPDEDLWQDPSEIQPEPSTPRLVAELPYYELVVDRGQRLIDEILADSPDSGYLLVAGGRQASEINASVSVDSGAGSEISDTMDFSPYGYLLDDISPTATTIHLTNTKDLDLAEVGTVASIGDEFVRVDLVDQDSSGWYVEVGRGVLDTVPAEHLGGSNPEAIIFWSEYIASDDVEYVASEELDVKLLTAAGGRVLSSLYAPTDSVVLNSRAVRPYPPGDLRIDGLSYPEGYTSAEAVTLTWAHRDRTQQTSGTIFDYTDGDIGPESGVTYRVEADAELADGSTSASFISENVGAVTSFIALDSSTPPPSGTVSVTFRVYAVRDGYDSWQAPSCNVSMFLAPTGLSGIYVPFAAPTDLDAEIY